MFVKIKTTYYQFQLDRLELHSKEIHEAHREASRRFYEADDMAEYGRFAGTDKAYRLRSDARIRFEYCAKREKDHLTRVCNLRRRISLLSSSRASMADAALLQ